MVSETVSVNLSADAEARPVAVLVQKASQYESRSCPGCRGYRRGRGYRRK